MISYMSNGNAMEIISTVELMKKISLYKTIHFAERHAHSKNKTKVELDLPDYATRKTQQVLLQQM